MKSINKKFTNGPSGTLAFIAVTLVICLFLIITEVNGEILPPGKQCIRNSSIKSKPEGPICQCKRGYCLVEKPEGRVCKKDYSSRYNARRNKKCDRSYSINPISTSTTSMPEIRPIQFVPTRSSFRSAGSWNEQIPTKNVIQRQGQSSYQFSDQGSFGFGGSDDYSDEDIFNEDLNYEDPFYDNSYDFDPIPLSTTPHSIPSTHPIYFGALAATLPRLNGSMSLKEENCFKSDRIYWPFDDQCYTLLQQGPCRDDESG